MRLYTIGYRDSETEKRLEPEQFYSQLPEDAVVVDIRSHPYSPFMREYSYSGVPESIDRWKPGKKDFFGIKTLGNVRRDEKKKRISPPIYVDAETGFQSLTAVLEEHDYAVIFCACSLLTIDSEIHRCHRFYVAEEMQQRLPYLEVIHLSLHAPTAPEQASLTIDS